MQLPFFYEEELPVDDTFMLSENSSHHIMQALRMKQGENILVTNGNGQTLQAKIIHGNKKKTTVRVVERNYTAKAFPEISIAIGLIKNKNRLEWFIEKASEMGIAAIFPTITSRTEKQSFNLERIKSISVSAMLQSQQSWLTEIHEPVKFGALIKDARQKKKFIAHCSNGEKKPLSKQFLDHDSLILIGPEGDFTSEEITDAIKNNFIPVSLGETRLRTETAGIVAAVLCKLSCQ